MNTNIIIPKKIEASQPKPSKAQLVEALLDRARKAHQKAEKEKTAKREKLEEKCIIRMKEHVKKLKPDDFEYNCKQYWYCNTEVEAKINFSTPEIQSLRAQMQKLSSIRFDENETKKKIQEAMKAPNPLLDNESVTAALDNLLATIMNPQAKLADAVEV